MIDKYRAGDRKMVHSETLDRPNDRSSLKFEDGPTMLVRQRGPSDKPDLTNRASLRGTQDGEASKFLEDTPHEAFHVRCNLEKEVSSTVCDRLQMRRQIRKGSAVVPEASDQSAQLGHIFRHEHLRQSLDLLRIRS